MLRSHRPPVRRLHTAVFFGLFAAPLFLAHLPLLRLPFFWDEEGQFVPTALDLLRTGAWVAHSAIPNVHPPGVEAYLAAWYRCLGYSIPATRSAMLLLAACGLLLTFLLAIELCRDVAGAPAFFPPLLLFVSPLFYMQSMMAQLDMPAMVFTLLSLLLFLKNQFAAAAAASVFLVLVKETGLVVPFAFFAILLFRRDWRRAAYFAAPALALAAWLLVLRRATGYWLGDPGFAHYNVDYALSPVRMALSLFRRIYYLCFAEFRWIGLPAIILAMRRHGLFGSVRWRIVAAVCAANVLLVTVLGGAELERYLLPVLPVFYIAATAAFFTLGKWTRAAGLTALFGGLAASIYWNPPYPFPFENNYAMVDFVHLQQAASEFAESRLPGARIATAWPYTAGLRRPDYGFVSKRFKTVETSDFHPSSIEPIDPGGYDALITYTRTWAPREGLVALPPVRRFLERFYDWQPDITPEECAALGLRQEMSLSLRGQSVAIYVHPSWSPPGAFNAHR
jgi:hypothetical protein